MSQLGSMFLAGINQGSDVAARAEGLRLANLEQQRREHEDRLRAEDQRRQLLEEDAGREFWGGQLRTLMAPDPTSQPEGPMGPQTGIPQQPPSPFTRMLSNPHVPAADLRYAFEHGQKLQQEQAEVAREQAETAQFLMQVDRYADMLERDGFGPEAKRGRAQAYAIKRWPSNWSKPIGVVEPTMPTQPGSRAADPAETAMRESMLGELSKTPAWQSADPATQLILAYRVRSGFSVSPRDLAMDGVDARYVHAGAEAAAQVEYRAAAADRDDARKLFNDAFKAEKKATKDDDKANARQMLQQAQARLLSANTAFHEAQGRLTALQSERSRVVQQAPAGPSAPSAPAPSQAPAPIDPGIIDQIMDQNPNATDEQIAEEIRRRSQP